MHSRAKLAALPKRSIPNLTMSCHAPSEWRSRQETGKVWRRDRAFLPGRSRGRAGAVREHWHARPVHQVGRCRRHLQSASRPTAPPGALSGHCLKCRQCPALRRNALSISMSWSAVPNGLSAGRFSCLTASTVFVPIRAVEGWHRLILRRPSSAPCSRRIPAAGRICR